MLVFEDLQWADSGLLDFIDHLLEWSRSRPIFVVTLARPELLERRPDWGAGHRNFTRSASSRCPSAMRELLAGLVPGPAGGGRPRTIVARADGIPLYAVETVRMLLADGRLASSDGVYQPVGDLADARGPEHAARADRRPARRARRRRPGAAPGRRGAGPDASRRPALAASAGVAADELEPRLRALVRRELLALEADPRSPERGQYAFVQALIREVAYSTLSSATAVAPPGGGALLRVARRRGAGRRAGDALPRTPGGRAEGPEGDAIAAQARIALRAAAERAAALHAPCRR